MKEKRQEIGFDKEGIIRRLFKLLIPKTENKNKIKLQTKLPSVIAPNFHHPPGTSKI